MGGTLWTLYTSSGDVVLLNFIFNGVAMIASNTALVWGFALLTSTILALRSSIVGTIEQHRHAGGVELTRGALHVLMPCVLATLLTSAGMRVKLQVENTTTGATTVIANVPVVIAAIPVGASLLANTVGPAISTAMTTGNGAYSDISVSGHGFLDPMRRLTAARGSIEHLGSVDTELRIVIGRCLSMDAGTDFTVLNNMVLNAGNTGATAAKSIPINGAAPTGVGALLWQAAQNTTGLVPELAINNATILNCTDAASLVASDITTQLQSAEFARVVQGAVNGMDQPLPNADYSAGQLLTEYTALRKWNSVTGMTAMGQGQANAEMINFLFDEEVSNGLNCAQASSTDKATCEATMIQATELERNNLQAAANEVPMLEYSGSFGNYILALIIGLGPVIVMFMMMFGVDSGRCVKTAMHVMVWPLLVTNVGAELVNSMLSMQFSNFVASLTQGGYLSPAAIHNAYKELSLQVGVGSHVMASLPVLMSMIFALGQAAGLASVAAEVTPKGKETGDAEAPAPIQSSALMRSTSPDTLRQGEGWSSVEAEGHVDAVSSSASFGALQRTATAAMTDSESRERRESEESARVHRVATALAHRDYKSLGLNEAQGEALRNELGNNLHEGHSDSTQQVGSTDKANRRSLDFSASGSYGANAGLSLGGKAFGVGGSGDFRIAKSAAATESQSLGDTVIRASDITLARAVSKTLSSDASKQILDSKGGDESKSLNDDRSAANSYLESVSHRADHTTSKGQALQDTEGFVTASQSIGTGQLAQHALSNGDFRQLQRMRGGQFDALPGAQQHLQLAQRDMDSRSTESIGGDPRARAAVLRHMAAVSMARDSSLPESARFEAVRYLVDEGNALIHGGFQAPSAQDLKSGQGAIALPKDATGVNQRQLVGQVRGATRGAVALTDPSVGIDAKKEASLESLHGLPAAAADERGLQTLRVPIATEISSTVDAQLEHAAASGLAAKGRQPSDSERAFGAFWHPEIAGAKAEQSNTTAPSAKPSAKPEGQPQ